MFLLFGKAFYAVSELVLPNKILFAEHFQQRLLFRFITPAIYFKSRRGKQSKSQCFYFPLRGWMSGFTSTWVRRTHAALDCCRRSKCIYGVGKIVVWIWSNRHRRRQTVQRKSTYFSAQVLVTAPHWDSFAVIFFHLHALCFPNPCTCTPAAMATA